MRFQGDRAGMFEEAGPERGCRPHSTALPSWGLAPRLRTRAAWPQAVGWDWEGVLSGLVKESDSEATPVSEAYKVVFSLQ
jgi:hypothetical protein